MSRPGSGSRHVRAGSAAACRVPAPAAAPDGRRSAGRCSAHARPGRSFPCGRRCENTAVRATPAPGRQVTCPGVVQRECRAPARSSWQWPALQSPALQCPASGPHVDDARGTELMERMHRAASHLAGCMTARWDVPMLFLRALNWRPLSLPAGSGISAASESQKEPLGTSVITPTTSGVCSGLPDHGGPGQRSGSQPLLAAWRTTSTRVLNPSLSIARALYVSMVFTLMASRAEISLLLYPLAIRRSTSVSRSLSSTVESPCDRDEPEAPLPTTFPAIAGSRYVPPAATA